MGDYRKINVNLINVYCILCILRIFEFCYFCINSIQLGIMSNKAMKQPVDFVNGMDDKYINH